MIKCKASKYSLYDYTTWMISVIPKPYVPAHWELQWSSSMEWIINEWILVDRHTERERDNIFTVWSASVTATQREVWNWDMYRKKQRDTHHACCIHFCVRRHCARVCVCSCTCCTYDIFFLFCLNGAAAYAIGDYLGTWLHGIIMPFGCLMNNGYN